MRVHFCMSMSYYTLFVCVHACKNISAHVYTCKHVYMCMFYAIILNVIIQICAVMLNILQ